MPEKKKITFHAGSTPEYIWKRSFDIDYWKRRLEKIDLDEKEDKKESFYLLLQLTDLYTHIIAAELRNPEDVWRMIKEETYSGHIENVLDYLETGNPEMPYDLKAFGEENKLATVEIEENLDENLDASQKAAMGLGVPIDTSIEGVSIRMEDSAEAYLRTSNFFLGFWKRVKDMDLYNSYKHGFRQPKFDEGTLEYLKDQFPMAVDINWDKLESDVKKKDTVFFMQLEEAEQEQEYTISVFEVQPKVSWELASIVLRLIGNLFSGKDRETVWEDFKQVMGEPDEMPYIYRERFKAKMFLDEDAVPEHVKEQVDDVDSEN